MRPSIFRVAPIPVETRGRHIFLVEGSGICQRPFSPYQKRAPSPLQTGDRKRKGASRDNRCRAWARASATGPRRLSLLTFVLLSNSLIRNLFVKPLLYPHFKTCCAKCVMLQQAYVIPVLFTKVH